MIRAVLVLVLYAWSIAAVAAQEPAGAARPDARDFVPAGYAAEYRFDLAAMRAHEVYGALRRSLASGFVEMMEQELGLSFDDVDALRLFPPTRAGDDAEGGGRRDVVTIVTGGDDLPLPTIRNHSTGDLQGYRVAVPDYDDGGDPMLWLLARPGVLVNGRQSQLQPVLSGAGAPGVPSPDALSMLSGPARGEELMHLVFEVARAGPGDLPFEWPEPFRLEGDAVRHAAARLLALPSADDPDQTVVEARLILRFHTGARGPEAAAAWFRERLEQAREHPRLGALRALWDAVELRTDGIDLVGRLPLGRPRDAVGRLVMALGPWLLLVERAPAPDAAPVGEPAPTAPEPDRDG